MSSKDAPHDSHILIMNKQVVAKNMQAKTGIYLLGIKATASFED